MLNFILFGFILGLISALFVVFVFAKFIMPQHSGVQPPRLDCFNNYGAVKTPRGGTEKVQLYAYLLLSYTCVIYIVVEAGTDRHIIDLAIVPPTGIITRDLGTGK